MKAMKLACLTGGLIWCAGVVGVAGTFSVYSVGNSLTDDLHTGFRYSATTYETGLGNNFIRWSIFRGGTSLPYLYNLPGDTITESRKATNTTVTFQSYPNNIRWTSGLPSNNWDVVTLEPYPGAVDGGGGGIATQGIDTTVISNFVVAAHSAGNNASARFYIYEPWPQVYNYSDTNDYSTSWLTSVANSPSQATTLCRGYFQNLFEAVKSNQPNIGMIPVGEVFYALQAKMNAGLIPGFTNVNQLHRDAYHLNNFGVDIAGFTAYATLFKQSPVGLADNPNIGTGSYTAPYSDPSVAMAAAAVGVMQQTVWEVVTQQNYYTLVLPTGVPVIGVQPQNQTVTVGQTATFTVGAVGTAPLSYQWYWNNNAIGGATNSSYTTAPITTIANGSQLYVIVTNTLGTAISSNATLTVTSNLLGLIFQADFNGASSGTGGSNDIVTFGGTGVLSANIANVTGAITNANPLGSAGSNYLSATYTLGNASTAYPAQFTFASAANSFMAFQGSDIINGNGGTNTQLHGAFDVFMRLDNTNGSVAPTYPSWFRPLDQFSTANGGGTLKLIFLGTDDGSLAGNGTISLQIFRASTVSNTFLNVTNLQGAVTLNGVSSANANFYNPTNSGGPLKIAAGPNFMMAGTGVVYHTAFTLKTDTNSGLITANLYLQTGTNAIDTTTSAALIASTVFRLNAASVGSGAFVNVPWNYNQITTTTPGRFDQFSMDCVRLFNKSPTSFPALGVLPAAAAPLPPVFTSATVDSGQITLNWANAGTLLWSTNVQGPWSTNFFAAPPYQEFIQPNQNRFYRLQQ